MKTTKHRVCEWLAGGLLAAVVLWVGLQVFRAWTQREAAREMAETFESGLEKASMQGAAAERRRAETAELDRLIDLADKAVSEAERRAGIAPE
jgi:hypothetical protein